MNLDFRVHRGGEPRHFSMSENILLRRGLQELAPEKINTPKLVATAALQAGFTASAAANELIILADLEKDIGPAATHLLNYLGNPHCSTFSSDLLIEKVVEAAAIPRLIVAQANEAPVVDRQLAAANLAIQSMFPELSETAVELMQRSLGASEYGADVLYEEQAGRNRILEIEMKTAKLQKRYFKGLAAMDIWEKRQELRQKTFGAGWGLTAFAVGGKGAGFAEFEGRSSRLMITSPQIGVDLGMRLGELVSLWLEEQKLALSSLKQLSLAIPHHFIAAQFAERLASIDQRSYDLLTWRDAVNGWLPAFTVLDAIRNAELPGLFVHFEHFPMIDITYVQKRS